MIVVIVICESRVKVMWVKSEQAFLVVFLTSFNFSTPGCDFKNKFKNSYLQNVLGEEESLGVVGSIGNIQYRPCSFA